jgi:hypothetical protein
MGSTVSLYERTNKKNGNGRNEIPQSPRKINTTLKRYKKKRLEYFERSLKTESRSFSLNAN